MRTDEQPAAKGSSEDEIARLSEQLKDEVSRAKDRLSDRMKLLQERSFEPRSSRKS